MGLIISRSFCMLNWNTNKAPLSGIVKVHWIYKKNNKIYKWDF